MSKPRRIMAAISGASGMIYACRLLQVLPTAYEKIYLTASDNAQAILGQELDVSGLEEIIPAQTREHFELLDSHDMFAPPASGSHDYDGLVIIPCSMGVVGRVASGVSSDLVTRSADVCLKERRKLVMVVRETPLSIIHLRNLTTLAEAGATILPAAPAFYSKPDTIADLADFIADRVMRALGTDTRLVKGWGE